MEQKSSGVNIPKHHAVKPQNPKRIKKTKEELKQSKSDRQKAYYRRTVGRDVKAQIVPRTSLIGMTVEEKRAHKAKLKRIRNKMSKEAILSD